jgi:hypothetical protein
MGETKRQQREPAGHRVKTIEEMDAELLSLRHAQDWLPVWDSTYHGPIKPQGPKRNDKIERPEPPPRDMVNLPQHYARNKIEPVYFAIENELNGFQFNIVKYAVRAPYKHATPIEDLKKILRYAEMWIKRESGDPDWWKASTLTIPGVYP